MIQKLSIGLQLLFLALVLWFGQGWVKVGIEALRKDGLPQKDIHASAMMNVSCSQLWVDGSPNDIWLQCELTHDTQRYCGDSGRAQLVDTVKKYIDGREGFDKAVFTALVGVQQGTAASNATDPLQALAEAQEQARETFLKSGYASGINASRLPDDDITDILVSFALQGQLRRSDFPLPQPDYLQRAFVGVPETLAVTACGA